MNVFNSTLFAVNREDHLIESQVIKKIKPEKMLMIGSGGCIALSLKVIFPKLDLSIVDINPSYLYLPLSFHLLSHPTLTHHQD